MKTREIPYLENGDRISRPEFERRYAAMPSHQKAEFCLKASFFGLTHLIN